MTEMTPEERQNYEHLVGNVTDELRSQNALRNLDLPAALIEEVARAIAINIDYAFELRWSPRWEGRPPQNSN